MERVAGARRRKRSDDFGEDIIAHGVYFTTIILCDGVRNRLLCYPFLGPWTFPQFGIDEAKMRPSLRLFSRSAWKGTLPS